MITYETVTMLLAKYGLTDSFGELHGAELFEELCEEIWRLRAARDDLQKLVQEITIAALIPARSEGSS